MNEISASDISNHRHFRIFKHPLMPVAAAVVCVGLDYMTGPFIQFPIAFVIPVALAAWFGRPVMAYSLSVFQPLCRLGFAFFWHVPWLQYYSSVNAGVRIAVLVLIAYLINRTARQTRVLEKEVKMLEGLLPVCSYCKKIRDEGDHWQQMEAYITKHSEAKFTHGICPECARRYFGGVLAKN